MTDLGAADNWLARAAKRLADALSAVPRLTNKGMLTARMFIKIQHDQTLLTLAMLLCATRVVGQTPMVPTPLKSFDGKDKVTVTYLQPTSGTIVEKGEHPVAALTRVYNTGNGQQLNALAIEILNSLSCSDGFFTLPTGKPCGDHKDQRRFDFKRDYLLVTWVGLDFSGKRIVYRIGVHDERNPDPYNVTLPGLGRSQKLEAGKKEIEREKPALYEVFMSVTADADHASLYVFTAQPDPLQAQIPAFAAAAAGPLFASAAKLFGNVNTAKMSTLGLTEIGEAGEKVEEPFHVSVKVSTLIPPLRRAKVKIADVAVQPFPYADFQRQISDVANKLLFIDARQSKCASGYVSLAAPQLAAVAKSEDCTGVISTPTICRSAFGSTLERTYSSAAADCARTNMADIEKQRSAMLQVDTEFRKLVLAQQPEKLTAENALTNTPLTHWSFGVLTAYAFGETVAATRVKVGNDGKLAPDPLSRQLTAFVVNVAPTGYPADAPTVSWAERVRGFIGVTGTPEFGFAFGVSVQIWKGVGANFGGAWMFIPTFGGENDRIGQAPADPNAPFGTAHATAVFVGAHYNFSGK